MDLAPVFADMAVSLSLPSINRRARRDHICTNLWLDRASRILTTAYFLLTGRALLIAAANANVQKGDIDHTVSQERRKELESTFLKALKEHHRIILEVCEEYSKSNDKDLYQEIAVQLWKAYPSFRHESRLSTWIRKVAENTALASFKKKRIITDTTGEIPDIAEADSEESAEAEDRYVELLRKLDKLDKTIVGLMMEHHTQEEIGLIIGLKEKSVTHRLMRLRARLKNLK